MTHFLESRTGADGPVTVTVMKSYTVPTDEADYHSEEVNSNELRAPLRLQAWP
ncbi:hypothetical protein [Streptomyces bobili]|uniref:Uncharacterized protein n=1 Tax=Streptomyces bobili TaxID=67280 RepID=A0ABZ1R8I9_9ACTN|nr:hypothetical protein [Streptomyces bobili]